MLEHCKDEKCEIVTDFMNNKLLPILPEKYRRIKHDKKDHRWLIEIESPPYKDKVVLIAETEDGLMILVYLDSGIDDNMEGVYPSTNGAKEALSTIEHFDKIIQPYGAMMMVMDAALTSFPKRIRERKLHVDEDGDLTVNFSKKGIDYYISVEKESDDRVCAYRDGEKICDIAIADPKCSMKLKKAIKHRDSPALANSLQQSLLEWLHNSDYKDILAKAKAIRLLVGEQ